MQELVESERKYRLWDRGEFSRFPFMLHTSFSQPHLSILGGQTVAACSAPLPPLPPSLPPREDCSGVGVCLPACLSLCLSVCLSAVATVETVALDLEPVSPKQAVNHRRSTRLINWDHSAKKLPSQHADLNRVGLASLKGPGLLTIKAQA